MGEVNKIEVSAPIGRSGEWEVSEFTVSESEAIMFNLRNSFHVGSGGRDIVAGRYKKLTYKGNIVMSNTPAEINDHRYFIYKAEGDILISGLGLGVVISGLLQKNEVKSITVIEKSTDVIKLVAPTFVSEKRVRIINADIFDWKPPKGFKYDYIWHDIWNDICGDNVEEMKKLHRKFGRYGKWQKSWCRDLCELQR